MPKESEQHLLDSVSVRLPIPIHRSNDPVIFAENDIAANTIVTFALN